MAFSLELPEAGLATSRWPRWLGGAFVALAFGTYYWLYFLPPRLIGSLDPDRFYHLALSRIIAASGLPSVLPQVEDLGWGRYFPDKEFLFHVLTGAASSAGGDAAVLWLVPVFGISIALLLYGELSRQLRPAQATLVAIAVPLITVGFMFRLTLLRPHLLAMLVFCCLLIAIIRERPKLAALAAAAFALSYHAIYMVGIVAVAAWLLRRQPGIHRHAWAWCLAGLVVGLIVNPYFPSNLGMASLTLRLALGIDAPPDVQSGPEILPLPPMMLIVAYAFLPLTLIAIAVGAWWRRPAPSPERSALLLLFLVTAVCTLLSLKSMRAMEYAVPTGILLVGYAARVFALGRWLPLALALLLGCQAQLAFQVYREHWLRPPESAYRDFAAALEKIPMTPGGYKVFNCEWDAGSFILMARPDLRFVDLLEPTMLWEASQTKYMARLGLLQAGFADPRAMLRGAFDADYVLCINPLLIAQMDALPEQFGPIYGQRGDKLRLFAIRPD